MWPLLLLSQSNVHVSSGRHQDRRQLHSPKGQAFLTPLQLHIYSPLLLFCYYISDISLFNVHVTFCFSSRPCLASCGCAVKSICLRRGWRVQRHWPTWWSPMWSCSGSQAPPTISWPCWPTTSNTPALCLPSLTLRGWVSGPDWDLLTFNVCIRAVTLDSQSTAMLMALWGCVFI